MRRIEQSLRLQRILEREKAPVQFARAHRFHLSDIELKAAVPYIERRGARNNDLLPILGSKRKLLCVLTEHDTPHDRPRVLQRKIQMSRAVPFEPADLTAHAHVAQRGIRCKQRAHIVVQFLYAERQGFLLHRLSFASNATPTALSLDKRDSP